MPELIAVLQDGQLIDLVNGALEEVELSEADKLLNAQLLEEAKRTSATSRHKARRLRKSGSGQCSRHYISHVN